MLTRRPQYLARYRSKDQDVCRLHSTLISFEAGHNTGRYKVVLEECIQQIHNMLIKQQTSVKS